MLSGAVSIPYWLGSKLRGPRLVPRLARGRPETLGFNPLLVGV
jgi:hypothetical protein